MGDLILPLECTFVFRRLAREEELRDLEKLDSGHSFVFWEDGFAPQFMYDWQDCRMFMEDLGLIARYCKNMRLATSGYLFAFINGDDVKITLKRGKAKKQDIYLQCCEIARERKPRGKRLKTAEEKMKEKPKKIKKEDIKVLPDGSFFDYDLKHITDQPEYVPEPKKQGKKLRKTVEDLWDDTFKNDQTFDESDDDDNNEMGTPQFSQAVREIANILKKPHTKLTKNQFKSLPFIEKLRKASQKQFFNDYSQNYDQIYGA